MIKELLVLLSEVVLSLYPTLIKTVDTSVFFQTGLRMFVFTALAVCAALFTGAPLPEVMSKTTLLTGLLNLVHVGSNFFPSSLKAKVTIHHEGNLAWHESSHGPRKSHDPSSSRLPGGGQDTKMEFSSQNFHFNPKSHI